MEANLAIKLNDVMLKSTQNLKTGNSPKARKSFKSPYIKSRSSLLQISNPPEKTEEILLKRRISKLTDMKLVVILEKAIDILAKPSEKRNLEEIFHLLKATENLDFFKKMKKDKEIEYFNPTSMNFKCCKALKYEYFQKGDAVFYQGDTADKFFIIIKGKVSVLLQKDSAVLEKEKDVIKHLRRNREIPDYLKKYQSPIIAIKKETSMMIEKEIVIKTESSANDEAIKIEKDKVLSLQIKKKFQKGISKVSNALLFLKSIEKSSENTKTVASLSAILPLALHSHKNLTMIPTMNSPNNTKPALEPSTNTLNTMKKIDETSDSTLLKPESPSFKPESPGLKGDNNSVNLTNNKKCLIPGLENKEIKNKDSYFDDGIFKYNVIQTLSTGDVFGELGIIRRKKRAATIICLENTHFAVLMKKDYESILLEQESNKLHKLIDFFNQTLFKKCSKDRMTSIAYMYKKRIYVKDQILFKEGQEPIECYIVKKGDIELSKSIDIKNNGKKRNKGKVAIISAGQFFGEEEILKNYEKRKYTAKVISVKASIFFITKQNFKKLLSEYKDIAKLFQDQVKTKEKWHSTKILQISNLLTDKGNFLNKIDKKKIFKSKAPLRATIDQLDLFCKDKKEKLDKIPILAFQSKTSRNTKAPNSIRKIHDQDEINEKKLYHQETHQFSSLVRANQLTLKALLKKKINVFELYSETKNLHHFNDSKYLTNRERSKTSSVNEPFKEKSSILHNFKTLHNLENFAKDESNSKEYLNVYTPIRKQSLPVNINVNINSIETSNTTVMAKKTNFIKTYEYFSNPLKKHISLGENSDLRRYSLHLKGDDSSSNRVNNDKIWEINLTNHTKYNGSIKENKNSGKEPKFFKFFEDEFKRNNNSNSIVVLNHMGKPIKFSNNH